MANEDLTYTNAAVKRAVLDKYDGDVTQDQIDAGDVTPVESVVIEFDENENVISMETIKHDAEGGDL
jgi:hypothetical protein